MPNRDVSTGASEPQDDRAADVTASGGAPDRELIFAFFNEIGIISQLSRTRFERVLPDGITVPHFSVLNHLARLGDGRAPLAIANAFEVPKATMTNTLAGLQRRGFIEFRANPSDGRSKLVYLTDAGRAFRLEAIGMLGPDMEAMASEFDLASLATALPVLRALRETLDRLRDR
ncbi:MAG: MarR family transcriptional regulator [Gammaproteobacteria bacterium]|nr:MarR family transcriptional regulator [Gammaproteobacteria bacterium]